MGEFSSYFSFPDVPAPTVAELNFDVFYTEAWTLLELLQPIFGVLGEVQPILNWTDPFKSFVVLSIFVVACLRTW